MSQITPEQIKRLFPNASTSTLKANLARLHPHQPQLPERSALGHGVSREETGVHLPAPRYRITFTCYACHPLDWDNYAGIKQCQDLIVSIGLLPGDAWHQLEGSVISRKAYHKQDERTEIEITPL